MPAHFQLAQFNISKMKAPLDDPIMAGFVSQLVPMHELAEKSPGFVWQHKDTDTGDSSSTRPYDDPLIMINLTVWDSVESLKAYTYRSAHIQVVRAGKKWFEPYDGQPYLVLWWIPAGRFPTVAEAVAKLETLRKHGHGPTAFDWKNLYTPPA